VSARLTADGRVARLRTGSRPGSMPPVSIHSRDRTRLVVSGSTRNDRRSLPTAHRADQSRRTTERVFDMIDLRVEAKSAGWTARKVGDSPFSQVGSHSFDVLQTLAKQCHQRDVFELFLHPIVGNR
jgi:hypothetical protein